MITPWEAIAALLARFGLPLIAVGTILRRGRRPPAAPPGPVTRPSSGRLTVIWAVNNYRFLTAGGLLCLPLLAFWGPLIVRALFR